MNDPVVILGTGGHAKVAAEVLEEEFTIIGFVGPSRAHERYLGSDDVLDEIIKSRTQNAFVAVGDNRLRYQLTQRALHCGFNLVNGISSKAHLSQSVVVGSGVLVMPGVVVNASTKIGNGCILNTGSTVDHDCILGDYVHIAPGVHMAGNVSVGQGSFIGVGSAVSNGILIGSWSVVGAGAVVVNDLPSQVVAYGIPARIRRYLVKLEEI